MSHAKRRTSELAPGLFPFMAVLLCLIGALVLILAITVTQSHASARRESEMDLLKAESDADATIAISEDLLLKRDQLRKEVEARRAALQDVEEHLKKLQAELNQTESHLKELQSSDESQSSDLDEATLQIEALKEQIEEKEKELAELRDGEKDKKPAFAIVPYSGKNGTSRRPIYIECTQQGIVVQPEGIVISPKDLIPPGPSNPLSVALRLLRSQYDEMDRKADQLNPPPYPLLLIRPDGIESYAYARQALADWDDQFGYELIDGEMKLAFPPSVPGTKELLEKVVADAKRRQIALLQANPQLARKYDLSNDVWPDEMNSNHPNSSFTGTKALNAGGADHFGGNRGDGNGGGENGDGWQMIQPAPAGGGNGIASHGGTNGSDPAGTLPFPAPREGATVGSGLAGNGTPMNQFSGGSSLPDASQLQTGGSAAYPNQTLVLGDASGAGQGGPSTAVSSGQYALDGSAASLPNNGGAGEGSEAGPSGGEAFAGGSAGDASSGQGSAASGTAATGSAGDAAGGGAAGGENGSGSAGGGSASIASNMEQSKDPLDPNATEPNQSVGASVQFGSTQDTSKPKFVNPEGDMRPIAVTAGKDWAQAKAEGKATPISRTIQIVALKDKWYIRREGVPKQFDAVISLDSGPQQVSKELTQAIRGQVDSWGLSISGGYWVPQVEIEAASDAQQSVERMQYLLEGSGVTIKVSPLRLQ